MLPTECSFTRLRKHLTGNKYPNFVLSLSRRESLMLHSIAHLQDLIGSLELKNRL